MAKINNLIGMYKQMSNEQLQEEIDAVFEIIFAMLEACECDSMESFPNPQIKIKFSCEVIKDESGKYYQ